jgi:hypothetical protein
MAVYRNADYQTRVWPSLQRSDGRTLELGPDETAELDLPDDFADPFLTTEPRRRGKRPKVVAPTETTEQVADGATETEDQGDAGSSDVDVTTEQES